MCNRQIKKNLEKAFSIFFSGKYKEMVKGRRSKNKRRECLVWVDDDAAGKDDSVFALIQLSLSSHLFSSLLTFNFFFLFDYFLFWGRGVRVINTYFPKFIQLCFWFLINTNSQMSKTKNQDKFSIPSTLRN